ncbi:hypothetical protein [Halorarius halobius]|uniref:hypothetical protein n=1 Tax=Halorarius halobius TaxID=2962671 RepID=UPI0020CFD8F1|nr:hypothetical protein [Halorarius halobius]
MRTYEYVCPDCGNTVERDYRVPSIVRSCENDCGWDHYVRVDLFEKVEQVPESARPDDWNDLSESRKLLVAMREGLVDLSDVQ